ncbi:MAG: DUF3786 domain-containing protein [Desulfobacterales bacterium]|jgi:hypothetical protein
MPQPKNAMEIFHLLDKSNCRECGKKTCLAFAGAVFKGEADLGQCPRLSREVVDHYSGSPGDLPEIEEDLDGFLAALRQRMATLDMAEAASRSGGILSKDRLTIKVLGKDVSVDSQGVLYTDIHVNPWMAAPFYSYVLEGSGRRPRGRWMSFRELRGGMDRYPLFRKRCEEAMKHVADRYPDLFDDMIHLFAAEQVEEQFASDISVVLHPLPKLPIMVCYWKPDEGMPSTLNLFFDETAPENLDIGSLFSLGAGLARMFEKLALRHGADPASHSRKPAG